MQHLRCLSILAVGLMVVTAVPSAQTVAGADRSALLDRILDVYVRDGYVYYAALKAERTNLDSYVASLDLSPDQLARLGDADTRAFWLNAYNALVLRTVINAYPIRGRVADYPESSVVQIPGGFDRIRHHVAGQVLTLDEIETTVIAGFGDARMLLALGRGAIGSGRLRSEVYRGARLEEQLDEAVEEFVTRGDCLKIDRDAAIVQFTPLFGWREPLFVKTFGSGGAMWADRSDLERAIVAMAYPHLFPGEREFLALNTFRTTYGSYDWRLNDLGGGTSQ